jgi:predicted P-loop ATPase
MSSDATNVVELGAKLVRVAFLEWYARRLPAGTFVQVVAIHPETGKIRAKSAPCDDVARLLPFIDEHASEWNLYFAVNPLREPKAKKATRDDIAALCCLHGDYDPRDGHEHATERQRISDELGAFPLRPSLWISSGHGLQAMWFLSEPVAVDGNADALGKHNKLLALLLGGDKTHDISRIMRLPGTTNFPDAKKRARGYEQAPAVVLESNERSYLLGEFGLSLLPVSHETRQLIQHGDTTGKYPSRSEAFMRVIGDLVRANVPEAAIEHVCLDTTNEISAHALGQKDPERALRRAIRTAQRDQPHGDWTQGLVRNKDGRAIADERNVLHALRTAPELRGLLRFDAFALQLQFTRSPPWRDVETHERWGDHDDVELLVWLQAQGIAFRSVNSVRGCVVVVARDNTTHPVREYLDALIWDGKSRLDSWLANYLGATGDERYLMAAGRSFLISAVARVYVPGVKADHMLVLEGIQGGRKSTTAEKLAVRDDWFVDSIGNVRDKDTAMQLAGRWLVEFAELEAMGKSAVSAMKAFVSRRIDKYRPPYGRTVVDVPRQCVFIGTTNESVYLKDQTGNRRYWPVRCGKVDIEAFERDRDQLWAEALRAFRAKEQWWLSDEVAALAEQEQAERVAENPVEDGVREFVAKRIAEEKLRVEARLDHIPTLRAFTTREVYAALGYIKGDTLDYMMKVTRIGSDVANALLRAGCKKFKRVGKGKNERTVYMLPGVAADELTADEIEQTRTPEF